MSAIEKIIDRLASEEYPDEKSMLRLRKMVEEARGELGALRDENRQLERNRCNSGHETLPLRLWDCPECGRIKREKLEAEIESLRAKVAAGHRLRQVVEAAAKDWAWQRSELHPMYLQHQCDLERNPVRDEEPRAECLACYRITMAKWAEAELDAYREAGKDGTK